MFGKKILSLYLAVAFVMSMAICAGAVMDVQYIPEAQAADTATGNITEMGEDLTPSFILLVFVMVFMMMLLTIVDRIGKR